MAGTGVVALFGGPAGGGKSTLARAWCATSLQAAHVELDEIRHLIVSGRADPQEAGDLQAAQYGLSVEATCALARAFADGGCDVAIDDVLEPAAFERYWRPRLEGLSWKLVVVLPSLDETLARSVRRDKRVKEEHTRTQHARCAEWDEAVRIDTTGLDLEQSLALVLDVLDWSSPAGTNDVYAQIRAAVLAKQQVVATYRGHRRELCPHVLGTKDGRRQALFFQFGGGSSSTLPPGGDWRCIPVDALEDVLIREGPWHTGSQHLFPETCVDEMDVAARGAQR